jgi:AcrR family transcriptional regulator
MPGENVDRRVKKTKLQLRLALMELMCEKPQKHISVRELAERADINRGTFYIHYKDVSDLLQQLEDEMADRLSEMCCLHARNTEIDSYPFLTDLYGFMLDNADICKVLLGTNGDIAYRQRICGILHDDFLYDFLSRFYPENRQKLEYFCAFIVSGNLNLSLTWLNEGAKESPEEMAQLAGEIIMKGVGFLR